MGWSSSSSSSNISAAPAAASARITSSGPGGSASSSSTSTSSPSTRSRGLAILAESGRGLEGAGRGAAASGARSERDVSGVGEDSAGAYGAATSSMLIWASWCAARGAGNGDLGVSGWAAATGSSSDSTESSAGSSSAASSASSPPISTSSSSSSTASGASARLALDGEGSGRCALREPFFGSRPALIVLSSHSRRANTPGLTRTSGFSAVSFFSVAARRAPIVTSGLLPTWLSRFFSMAMSVISL